MKNVLSRPFIKVKLDIEPSLLPLDHEYITTLKEKIFCCFADEDEIVHHLKTQARILSGHYEDKLFVLFIGQRNSGKGVIIELNSVAFQKYVTDVTLPVAKATASTDIAASNRWVLTQNHHIARLAYGNEVAVLANKPAVLDGEVLKKVIASGGDNVSARVMYGNEISVRVNTVSVFAVNESLSANPPNAMETGRLQCTSLSFGAPDPSSDFSGAVKKDDPNIKSWSHNTPWVPHAYLSLLAHYWGNYSSI